MPRAAGIVTCTHLAGSGRRVVSGGLAGAVRAAVTIAREPVAALRWWGTEWVCLRWASGAHCDPSTCLSKRPLSPGQGRVGLAGSDGRYAGRQPGPVRSPSQMEVLDEFDTEFPQSVTFCQLISQEDFERQAATYTERALRSLFRSLNRNPALAERVVRKGKQAECERRGLLSFLWVRAAGGAAGGGGQGPQGQVLSPPAAHETRAPDPRSVEALWGLAGFAG